MAISTKDYDAFVERFEKEYGVHPNAVDQSNLAFELKQSRRFKFPDVEVHAQGAPRKLIIPIEDAEFIRKAFNEVLGAFRKVDRMYRRESAWDDDTSCSICGKTLRGTPEDDVVDAYKYEIDGDIDYISLMHRACAKRKGYSIDAKGHVKGQGPRDGVNEARVQPAEKMDIVTKFDLRYEQSLGSGEKWVDKDRKPYVWYDQMFGDKWQPIGGWVFPLETYNDARKRYKAQGIELSEAAEPEEKRNLIRKQSLKWRRSFAGGEEYTDATGASYFWYDGAMGMKREPRAGWVFPGETYHQATKRYRDQDRGLREAVCTGCMGSGIYKHEGDAREYQCPYCKGSGKSPYPVKERVERVNGRFQVVDNRGKPVGSSHPSYSAAQKADQGGTKKRILYNTADAAPGDARVAEGRTLPTFGQFMTESVRRRRR